MGTQFSSPCNRLKATNAISHDKKIGVSLQKERSGLVKEHHNKYSSRIRMHQGDYLSPKTNRFTSNFRFTEKICEEANDSLSQDSTADQGARFVICSSEITSFKTFIDEVADTYESNLIPTHVAMHPYLSRPLMLLQAQELTPWFKKTQDSGLKYKQFVRRFESISRSGLYQEITAFLRKKYEAGLDYVGYFKTDESIPSTEYNFIFIERGQGSTKAPYLLQFETLDSVDENIVSRVLSERARDGYKFKGMICWDAEKDPSFLNTSMQNKSLILNGMHVMIFERDEEEPVPEYHVVELRKNELDPGFLESKVSGNIEQVCEINNFEVAGIVSSTTEENLLIILSESNKPLCML